MRYRIMTYAILLAMLFLCFSACSNYEKLGNIEIEEMEYEAEFAIPLVNSALDLQDILDQDETLESYLEVDEAGNMTLVYQDEIFSFADEEMITSIPDFPLVLPDRENEFPFNFMTQVAAEEMLFKSGTIAFELESMEEIDVNVNIVFPEFKKDGLPLSISARINYEGTLPAKASIAPVSLAGYMFEMSSERLYVNYEAVTTSGNQVTLESVEGTVKDWEFSYMKGNWQKTTLSLGRDTLDIDFYENAIAGNLQFADPQVTLIAENSFGVPLHLDFNTMGFVTENGYMIHLEHNKIENGLMLNYPSLNDVGNSVETNILFNRDNSNVDAILSAFPRAMVYDINAVINPENNYSTNGFVTDASSISVSLGVELPIYGTASDFKLEKMAEADFSDLENVLEGEFKLITQNSIPLDVALQVEFLDENQNVLTKLFPEIPTILGSAIVDASGEFIEATTIEKLIPVDAEKMQVIKSATIIRINAVLSTYNDGQENVRIKNTQGVDVKLGVRATVRR